MDLFPFLVMTRLPNCSFRCLLQFACTPCFIRLKLQAERTKSQLELEIEMRRDLEMRRESLVDNFVPAGPRPLTKLVEHLTTPRKSAVGRLRSPRPSKTSGTKIPFAEWSLSFVGVSTKV